MRQTVKEKIQIRNLWRDHFSVVLNSGGVLVPKDDDIDRLIAENIKAIDKVNPAAPYMRVYEAGQWSFPNPGDESDCDRIKMARREEVARMILNSAPDKMHARFGGFGVK